MKIKAGTLIGILLCCSALPALGAGNVRIASAAITEPLAQEAWSRYANKSKADQAAIEIMPLANAIKKLCAEGTVDIVFATRPMTEIEKSGCASGGNLTTAEMPIGYYGVVFANAAGTPKMSLTKKQIYMALAAELPDANGKLVKNPYNAWNEVDASLPPIPISVYGPPVKPGLHYMLTDAVMFDGCKKIQAILDMPPDRREKACRAIRTDGKYKVMDSAASIATTMQADKNAIAVLDLHTYGANTNLLQSAKLEGMMPEQETIGSVRYTVIKNLYVYANKESMLKNSAAAQFLQYLTSDEVIGKQGYLLNSGLAALNSVERKTSEETAQGLTIKK
jgi:phosphate transport system substrate-binding protein